MGLDIRLPLGLFFTLLGALLAVFGLFSDIGLNLVWGLVMMAFGIACLALSRQRKRG